MKRKKMILVGVVIVIVLGALWRKSEMKQISQGGTKADDYDVNTPVGIVNGWSRFESEKFNFSLPNGWNASKSDLWESNRDGLFERNEALFLSNNLGTVGIIVSPKQLPYGIETGEVETKELGLQIEGQQYAVLEQDTSDYGMFVDLVIKHSGADKHILFGTGYPVTGQSKKSVDDFRREKENIVKILSLIEFVD